MAGSAGSIFVDLLLRDAQYSSSLNRNRSVTRQFATGVSKDLNQTAQAFSATLSPVNNLAAGINQLGLQLAAAFSVQKIVRYSDTFKQLEGRLSLVAGGMENVSSIQQQLFDIAQRTRQPLEAVTSLYTRLNQAVPEAARAQYDLLGVTESINLALAITGEGSAQAASAVLQFSQAISSDFKGSSQEINSLLDSAPRLAQAIQRSFGDGSKSLKQLAKDGELSSDGILKALGAIGAEGAKLRGEFENIGLTVGQAFTQLDNAFLKFIGQNQLVADGTSSLAAGISVLAQNIDLLANAVILISGVFAGRLIGSLAASSALWLANTQQVLAYQIALGRMAGVSAAAAGGITALGAATTALGRGIALLGGPIGLAFIAVLTAATLHTNQAVVAEERYNGFLQQTVKEYGNYANASEKAQASIAKSANERIKIIEGEINQLQSLVDQYAALSSSNVFDALGVGIQEGLGKLGIGTAPSEVLAQYEAALKSIKAIREAQRDGANPNAVSSGSPFGSATEVAKVSKELKEANSLFKNYEQILTGVNAKTLEFRKVQEDLNKIKAEGLINDEQMIEALRRYEQGLQETEDATEAWGINIEEFGKSAATNIQSSFADFLFDPFQDGVKGMAKGFIDAIRKMIAEAQAAQFAKYLFGGSSGGGGLLGSIGSAIFGSSPAAGAQGPIKPGIFDGFFADGGYIQPGHFGIAGEAGAEMIYGGKTGMSITPISSGGGNTYYVDATGADQGSVLRLQQALLSLAGPGVIERRVANAQTRGAIS